MGKFDMYAEVTKRVIELLEAGTIPWEKPWVGVNGAWSRAKEGKYYCLINQFLLPAGEYATRDEIFRDGGHIKKGAKQKQVWRFYYKRIEETDENTGEITEKFIPRQSYLGVFNIAEDTDLEVKYHREEMEASGVEPITGLENIKNDYVARSGVTIEEYENARAFYAPMVDKVVVPAKRQFELVAEYYSTLFHELAHSTGHSTRLNRFDSDNVAAFGSDDYSREELVAELTSCAILANTGVETSSSFRNNSAYIGAWVAKLKEDSHAIIRAAAKAERAYNLIMGIEESFESADA